MTPTEMRDTPTEEEMREAVARIIDPSSFRYRAMPQDGFIIRASLHEACDAGINLARRQATEILAILSVQPSRPQGGWQPIETAPKDGTLVDLWWVEADREGRRIANAHWSGSIKPRRGRPDGWWAPGYDYEGEDGWIGPSRASHWMPLPEPPSLSRDPQQGEG